MEVAGKGGNGGHDDPDHEGLTLPVGAEDAVDDDGAQFVADGALLLAGGGDEELVDVSAPDDYRIKGSGFVYVPGSQCRRSALRW